MGNLMDMILIVGKTRPDKSKNYTQPLVADMILPITNYQLPITNGI